jgi:hypothetical protein
MAKITYRRKAVAFGQPITVVNELGRETTFSDHLAYHAFAEGIFKLRSGGVDIILIDSDGQLLVGDFSDKTVAA